VVDGLNIHCRAAFSARSAKYLLGPEELSFASTTLPDGSTWTRTVILTLPLIVLLAFPGISGNT
jgi:hypothetical protein